MPRFDPAEFGRLLARLTPQELRQAEGMVAEARVRAEAVLEIDARAEADGPAASCPRCGSVGRVRWGRTRTGAQRWRCSGFALPFSGGHAVLPPTSERLAPTSASGSTGLRRGRTARNWHPKFDSKTSKHLISLRRGAPFCDYERAVRQVWAGSGS
jgi:predicted RNA-binding Zn-ribbon protein involved in translation (DUF1610 family)